MSGIECDMQPRQGRLGEVTRRVRGVGTRPPPGPRRESVLLRKARRPRQGVAKLLVVPWDPAGARSDMALLPICLATEFAW
jgi:hypothetical protein